MADELNPSKCQNEKITENVGFIGAGNMATAIGMGIVKSGIITPTQIYVSAPSQRNLNHWKNLGVNTTTENSDVINKCPIVILAVKPQYAVEAINSLFSGFNSCPVKFVTLVSVLVGVTIDKLKEMISKSLPEKELASRVNVVRTMPNTPILVGEGCTVYCSKNEKSGNEHQIIAFKKHKDIVKLIFSANGFCCEIEETLINAAGALSGSGPAYVYQMIEALSDGAVKLGLPRALSYTLAAQAMVGAGKMVLTTGKHPGQLKDEVCSPGGTTIAGISAMERNGIRSGLIEAIKDAYEKSVEIGSRK